MIEQISKINNFGIFKDFLWDADIPNFGKYNLIYGWNYSGKTTLSRIFQAMEFKKNDDDFGEGFFEVILADSSTVNNDNLYESPDVRVFNRRYIENNFKSECSAKPLFIIGEESVELYERVEQLKKRISQVETIIEEYKANRNAKQNEMKTSLTDTARNIRHVLGDPKFERPQLENRIQEISGNPDFFIMSDEAVSANLNTFKSGEKYNEHALIPTSFPDLNKMLEEINELLKQTASQRVIERLKEYPQIEVWVRQGLRLHEHVSICEFCGAALDDKRLEELSGHFSNEYEQLMNDLESKVQHIKDIKLKPTIPSKKDLLPNLRGHYSQLEGQLSDWIIWATGLFEQFVEELERKRITIERSIQLNPDMSQNDQGNHFIQELNKIVKDHNEAVQNIERQKSEIKQSLECHYAAQYYLDSNYQQRKTEIEHIDDRIKRAEKMIIQIKSQISEKKEKIKMSATGTDELNKLLNYLLPGNNIEVVNIDDAIFEFHRGEYLAKCLSEGEKTAVTFAHFLISLEENDSSIADTIIFIDDPVSSLDSNHIYAVYAIIVAKLSNCLQIFVSTHNNELFNLLKGYWLDDRKDGGKTKESKGYYVNRTTNFSAELIELPNLLRCFKSEYEFVFKHLYDYSITEEPQPDAMAFLIPNLLRKFLEAYLGFRKPNIRSWSQKMNLLFDTPEERREIQKFADDASHLQSLNRSLSNPDYIANSKKCVTMVLNALEEKDECHYASLIEIVKNC